MGMKPQGMKQQKKSDVRVLDTPRPSPYARGYDGNWKKVRSAALARDRWLCQLCGRPSNIVDHIMPIATHPQLRLTLSNLQVLCKSCHSAKTRREQLTY